MRWRRRSQDQRRGGSLARLISSLMAFDGIKVATHLDSSSSSSAAARHQTWQDLRHTIIASSSSYRGGH
jgi:hypothetical protein